MDVDENQEESHQHSHPRGKQSNIGDTAIMLNLLTRFTYTFLFLSKLLYSSLQVKSLNQTSILLSVASFKIHFQKNF